MFPFERALGRLALRACAGMAFAASSLAGNCSWAQSAAVAYPNKPIRLIVASGAGGGLDFVARVLATPLGEVLGQTVVVDNRAGASGSIAAELCAQAPADGYTLLFLSASLVVYGIVNKTRYDLERDFVPVSQAAAAPYLLTVYPGLPVKGVKDLIAYAKAYPGKLNYASTGNASLAHLATELFALSAGIKLTHIPYKGVGAGLTDMLSGQVQMSFLSMGSVFAQVRAQKLRALAIASSTRAKMAPEVPTMIEAGVPAYVVTQWHGMMAPRATPGAIVARLHAEIVKVLKTPEVSSRLALDGTEAIGSSPSEFAAHLASERAQWARIARQANIRGD
jgi:tripartite-type tricarboxylate transporter receptor subunit TctC